MADENRTENPRAGSAAETDALAPAAAVRREPLLLRLPVVRDIRRSVGLQRGMLLTGVVIVGAVVLCAVLAPLIAPSSTERVTTLRSGCQFLACSRIRSTVSGQSCISPCIVYPP